MTIFGLVSVYKPPMISSERQSWNNSIYLDKINDLHFFVILPVGDNNVELNRPRNDNHKLSDYNYNPSGSIIPSGEKNKSATRKRLAYFGKASTAFPLMRN